MFVSYETMLVVLIIVAVAIVKSHRMGMKDCVEDSYDEGYEAAMKDFNYDFNLQREFEDFLYEKGYVIDKSLKDIKTMKPIKKQVINN